MYYNKNDVFILNNSNTNEDTLSDGSSLQEFSIRLEADIDEKYQDDLINLVKPMGFHFDLVKAEIDGDILVLLCLERR